MVISLLDYNKKQVFEYVLFVDYDGDIIIFANSQTGEIIFHLPTTDFIEIAMNVCFGSPTGW